MDVLIRPIVTEKMNAISDKLHKSGFIVNRHADKQQIKEAVEKMYDVKVISVNTMVYGGKLKSRYTKKGLQVGRTNSFKKAIVTLEKGQVIDFYNTI